MNASLSWRIYPVYTTRMYQAISRETNTHPKFNIAPEKSWLKEYFPKWEGNFSGVMLNFGGGYSN